MVEIMTDKATVEIGSPKRRSRRQTDVRRGGTLPRRKGAHYDRGRGRRSAVGQAERARQAAVRGGRGARLLRRQQAETARCGGEAVLATPATRKLARDIGVDIRQVAGSGRAGRITSEDVKAHGEWRRRARSHEASASARRRRADPLPRAAPEDRRAAGAVEADGAARHLRRGDRLHRAGRAAGPGERAGAGGGEKLSFLPFIIKATIAALRKYPQMNAMLDDAAGEIIQWQSFHIGLATATENGLIVPVIRDADRKSLAELGRDIERLAERNPHRQGDAGRAHRLDLHHHQPGRARRRDGDGDHQPARGGDPGRAPDREAAGGRGQPDRHPRPDEPVAVVRPPGDRRIRRRAVRGRDQAVARGAWRRSGAEAG